MVTNKNVRIELNNMLCFQVSQPERSPQAHAATQRLVGGVTYTLTGQMDTKMYNCLNDCVYQKEGQTGAKF